METLVIIALTFLISVAGISVAVWSLRPKPMYCDSAATLLATVRGIEAGAGSIKALKVLYMELDRELKARNYDHCSRVISECDPDRDSVSLMLGVITILYPVRENLKGFENLRDRLAKRLEREDRNTNRLLGRFY